jgi:predicted nucleic acid-binding protein
MILADTSAFIEFLRATGSPTDMEMRRLIAAGAELLTTDPVVMEVLAGARDGAHAARLRAFLLRFEHIPVEGLGDFEKAATLYRTCRADGVTVRSLTDCLIAAVAIRTGSTVLERDRDFGEIAARSDLVLHRPT